MTKIEISESLRAYFDNKAVRRAVDELVDQLDGTDMPNCDWEEAKNYNQALLMAAQVRAGLHRAAVQGLGRHFRRCGPSPPLGRVLRL